MHRPSTVQRKPAEDEQVVPVRRRAPSMLLAVALFSALAGIPVRGGIETLALVTSAAAICWAAWLVVRRDDWMRERLFVDEHTGMLTATAFVKFATLELERAERMSEDAVLAAFQLPDSISARELRSVGRILSTGIRSYDLCYVDASTSTTYVLLSNVTDATHNELPLLERLARRLDPAGVRGVGYERSTVFGSSVALAMELAREAADDAVERGSIISRSRGADLERVVAATYPGVLGSCMEVLDMLPTDRRMRQVSWAREVARRVASEVSPGMAMLAELAALVRIDDADQLPHANRRLRIAMELLQRNSGVSIERSMEPRELVIIEQILADAWSDAGARAA